jgi:RNA polymerase sigma-70 factor, ECF subfamily
MQKRALDQQATVQSDDLHELDLVNRAQSGETSAFEELMTANVHRVWVSISRLVPSAIAEDLVQETFVKAWQSLRQFRCESKFSTWITVIAVRTATRWLQMERYPQPRAPLEHLLYGHNCQKALVSMRASDPSGPLAVWQCIERMKPIYALPLVLKVVEGFTHREIAKALQLPKGTVDIRVSRGLEQLRKCLAMKEPR